MSFPNLPTSMNANDTLCRLHRIFLKAEKLKEQYAATGKVKQDKWQKLFVQSKDLEALHNDLERMGVLKVLKQVIADCENVLVRLPILKRKIKDFEVRLGDLEANGFQGYKKFKQDIDMFKGKNEKQLFALGLMTNVKYLKNRYRMDLAISKTSYTTAYNF
mmetsp:Transcript_12621/g.14475  ORF Transcript_12621/g.14475 Transcript_12621/m.14475 type:complete len:161 (+) Transcript_12621:86-568(+)